MLLKPVRWRWRWWWLLQCYTKLCTTPINKFLWPEKCNFRGITFFTIKHFDVAYCWSVQLNCLIFFLCTFSAYAFSALTLLVGHQEEHPACKNRVMRFWCRYLSGARCRLFAYTLWVKKTRHQTLVHNFTRY